MPVIPIQYGISVFFLKQCTFCPYGVFFPHAGAPSFPLELDSVETQNGKHLRSVLTPRLLSGEFSQARVISLKTVIS